MRSGPILEVGNSESLPVLYLWLHHGCCKTFKARYLFSPSVDSFYMAYQVQDTTEFPPLQGFQQSLVSPFCSTLQLVPLSMYCVWEAGHADCIPSRE